MTTFALRSTRVLASEGVRAAVLEVRDGVIRALHAHDAVPAGIPLREVGDHVVMPGVIDSHVHINEPGRTAWEGFRSATLAAAAGGVTTLADMPLNSIPATVSLASLGSKRAAANGQCAVDVGLLAGIVPGRSFEWRALLESGCLAFKCFLVPSGVDEFPPVDARRAGAARRRRHGALRAARRARRGPRAGQHARVRGVRRLAPGGRGDRGHRHAGLAR
jgi:allantoinase